MIQESFNHKIIPNFSTCMNKGDLGELFFKEFLERRGWVVYKPTVTDRAHFCDIFATRGKRELILADVKTKARLNKTNATGINLSAYNDYLHFAKNYPIPFHLVFVNDKDGEVHSCNILTLEKSKSGFLISNDRIICWPISVMRKLFTLNDEQVASLSAYDQRNYAYSPK